MKILVTGGAGFIGLSLAKELASRGHQLVLVDCVSPRMDDEALTEFIASDDHRYARIDLRMADALSELPEDFDIVCHLAALLGVATVIENPLAVLTDNVVMNIEVLRFAQRQRALKRFLFASTSEVYAGTLTHFELPFPTPEATPLAIPELACPRTSYMLSKLYGEALVHHSRMPFTIIRPHNIYGPRMGMRHVVPQLMQRIFNTPVGGEFPVYSPEHRRTFCFVDDASKLIAAALESQSCAGRTLNVGCERPEVTMKELARMIVAIMKHDVTPIQGPVMSGSPSRRQPDISKIIELTGERPTVDLSEGLRRTHDWYRRHAFKNAVSVQ